MRRFWRRERNDQQSAEKAQWVFADGDTEDVDEDDKRRLMRRIITLSTIRIGENQSDYY